MSNYKRKNPIIYFAVENRKDGIRAQEVLPRATALRIYLSKKHNRNISRVEDFLYEIFNDNPTNEQLERWLNETATALKITTAVRKNAIGAIWRDENKAPTVSNKKKY